jgi:hypothetical protein
VEDSLRDLLEDDELGHGVRDPRAGYQYTSASIERESSGETHCLNRMGPKPA